MHDGSPLADTGMVLGARRAQLRQVQRRPSRVSQGRCRRPQGQHVRDDDSRHRERHQEDPGHHRSSDGRVRVSRGEEHEGLRRVHDT